MTILLFGISNVGKTTIGREAAKLLGISFYDLDDELKASLNVTLETFVNTGSLEWRDRTRGRVLADIIYKHPEDKIIAVCPISCTDEFFEAIPKRGIKSIELVDTPENVFERLVFSDENDVIYKDDEYKMKHKAQYLRHIAQDLLYYGLRYDFVDVRFNMEGCGIEEASEILADLISDFSPGKVVESTGVY